jgi:amino acid transporter
MKRNVLIFGLVLGTLLCINMVYMANLCYTNPDFESNDVIGYTVLVVVFSLTFFGIKNYRDKELNGVITFGKAFKTGALIAFFGATAYVVVWLFYYYLFIPDFLDKYIPHAMLEATRDGASASELATKKEEMQQFKEMYQNPVFVVLISYAEVFPIGLIVALISALILKKKPDGVVAGHKA